MEPEFTRHNFNSTKIVGAVTDSPLMNESSLRENIAVLQRDVDLLAGIFRARLGNNHNPDNHSFKWPSLQTSEGPYASVCSGLSDGERTLLLVSLLPHYAPEVLREMIEPVQQGLLISNYHVGGLVKRTTQQFIPTLQTVLFILAGSDKTLQQLAYRQLVMEGSLIKRQIVSLREFENSESIISDKELIPELAEEYVHYFLQGRQPRPDFGKNFPANILTTDKNWEDLILSPHTKRNVDLMIDWVEHGVKFTEETKGVFAPGYPVLFYGPPGTGKSLTAALIGKHCDLHVFRVDASQVVSKYIGETEKNLVHLFQRMKVENARHTRKSILFFDEADVLFSKRTEVKDAKDKWANMETSVLLPLIEDYGGLAIVATNFEHNLDSAMDRRFQLKVKFAHLSYSERIIMWEKGIPDPFSYPSTAFVSQLARYKLSPASIINVLKGSCLLAHKKGSRLVDKKDLEYFIHQEFAKSGLTPSWDENGSATLRLQSN